MPYQSPTLTELIKQGQQDIQVNFPNVRMHSVLSVLNRVNAGLSAGEHQHLDWLANQIIPTTADEEYLLEYARMKGIYKIFVAVCKARFVRGMNKQLRARRILHFFDS